MTVTTQELGYLESGYGEEAYLTTQAQGSAGLQTRFVIESSKPVGLQAELTVIDFLKACGVQADFTVESALASGLQFNLEVDGSHAEGIQFNLSVTDLPSSFGVQFNAIVTANGVYGTEFRSDKYPTLICDDDGYLTGAYLEDAYLSKRRCLVPGVQARFLVQETKEYGLQARFTVESKKAYGVQARLTIADFKKFLGIEFDAQNLSTYGIQFLASLYNTTNLRILCDFASRGLAGSNWTSNSTAAGDFSVNNVNTDIVEQVWRSTAKTGVTLSSDTGIPQGVIIDTLAILNHNLTSSATVNLIGSDNPGHAPTGIVIPLEAREDNMFYIAADLPSTGFRYWRLAIDDASNPDPFLQIGTIVYGTSQILHGECFVDEVEFTLKDFADTVMTEGFTNVANSRSIKRSVRLEFRSLDADYRNFKVLRGVFQSARTTLKCLWIPTPDAEDQEVTAKFATFGKINVLPSERHNSKGKKLDYVSMSVEVDESL